MSNNILYTADAENTIHNISCTYSRPKTYIMQITDNVIQLNAVSS